MSQDRALILKFFHLFKLKKSLAYFNFTVSFSAGNSTGLLEFKIFLTHFNFKFFCFLSNFFFSFWTVRLSATELNVSAHVSKSFHGHKNLSRHLHILHGSKWDTEKRECENVFCTPKCATECQGTCAKGVVFIWRHCLPSRRGNPGSFSTSVQYSPFPIIGYDFWHHLLVWIESMNWIITAYVLMQTSVSTPVNIRNFTAHMF